MAFSVADLTSKNNMQKKKTISKDQKNILAKYKISSAYEYTNKEISSAKMKTPVSKNESNIARKGNVAQKDDSEVVDNAKSIIDNEVIMSTISIDNTEDTTAPIKNSYGKETLNKESKVETSEVKENTSIVETITKNDDVQETELKANESDTYEANKNQSYENVVAESSTKKTIPSVMQSVDQTVEQNKDQNNFVKINIENEENNSFSSNTTKTEPILQSEAKSNEGNEISAKNAEEIIVDDKKITEKIEVKSNIQEQQEIGNAEFNSLLQNVNTQGNNTANENVEIPHQEALEVNALDEKTNVDSDPLTQGEIAGTDNTQSNEVSSIKAIQEETVAESSALENKVEEKNVKENTQENITDSNEDEKASEEILIDLPKEKDINEPITENSELPSTNTSKENKAEEVEYVESSNTIQQYETQTEFLQYTFEDNAQSNEINLENEKSKIKQNETTPLREENSTNSDANTVETETSLLFEEDNIQHEEVLPEIKILNQEPKELENKSYEENDLQSEEIVEIPEIPVINALNMSMSENNLMKENSTAENEAIDENEDDSELEFENSNGYIYGEADPDQFVYYHRKDIRLKLHTGEKRNQLLQSIKISGIHEPILVRKAKDNKFEIIAGHNRHSIAAELGIKVPYLLLPNVSDDYSDQICVDTNLLNRQHNEMLPSELSNMLMVKRKMFTLEKVAEEFHIASTTMKAFLKLQDLLPELLYEWVDTKKIGMTIGYALACSDKERQQELLEYLKENNIKSISVRQGKEITNRGKLPWNKDFLDKVFGNEHIINPETVKPQTKVSMTYKELGRYLNTNDLQDAKKTIYEALTLKNHINTILNDSNLEYSNELIVKALEEYLSK